MEPEARTVLAQLDADRSTLAGRITAPWWLHLTLAGLVAVVLLAPLSGGGAALAVAGAGVIGMIGLAWLWTRTVGSRTSAPG